ncbi:MAG: hypothetical protein J1E43_12665 [Christensenellaceae bacterium]|nr:hypothetical protein [Christensenellaceae bacterium]
MDRTALELLVRHPARVARWCGQRLLTDELHGPWMREMIAGQGDMTLLSHRGSYKTTCLAVSMAIMLLAYPRRNILFMRKTDDDVTEIIRQVKQLLLCDAMQLLSSKLYGSPVALARSDMHSLSTDCYAAPRGAPQLVGQGIGGSLTGKHADIVITDDIVNLQDRLSPVERDRTRLVYQELQNIRNPGGRIINTGTPWHPEDAISLMPNVRRWDCYQTGLLTPGQLEKLRQVMTPSLFAANYELKHIAREDALLDSPPRFTADESLMWDGIAHIDAAYGGADDTALTCGRVTAEGVLLYGRLWHGHVDAVIDEILAECDRLRCGPIHVETNGDRGYLARELRLRGAMVRPYFERLPKAVKISAYLRKHWPRTLILEGTDRDYLTQLMDYSDHAAHDDAPDSAACMLRLLERKGDLL